MKSHFIKDTNEQYSIREDGVLISHSTYHQKRDIEIKLTGNKACIKVNNKWTTVSTRVLLIKYFNTIHCKTCSTTITTARNKYCKECARKRKSKRSTKWKDNNHDRCMELSKEQQQRDTKSITKGYVSNLLRLNCAEITDELYNHHRNLLLLKRHISKENNIHINTFN
jgi:hypothetical protein